MTLLLPLPLGPTTEEKDCGRGGVGGAHNGKRSAAPPRPAERRSACARRRALWNGPMRCAPA